MSKVNLAAPWEVFHKEIETLFGEDPDIEVLYDDDETSSVKTITLHVEGATKADALATLLPAEKSFGNVTVRIEVVPANEQDSKISLFEKAFYGNPAFAYTESREGAMPMDYVVFEKEVVQMFIDNLADLHGLKSTLYEEIARDVFGDSGVMFCTDVIYDPDDDDETQSVRTVFL